MLVIQRPTVEAIDEAEGNIQRFAVGPLEPGFGHTIGNSLRRTLLSCIPGAAVTQVRFDDALHEFDTIEGVAQDVTDIILNLKDLVLVVHSDEPVTLRLDARGAAEVTAADIQPHPDVEVLNGALEIASLNGKGRLAVGCPRLLVPDETKLNGVPALPLHYVSRPEQKELRAAQLGGERSTPPSGRSGGRMFTAGGAFGASARLPPEHFERSSAPHF